MEDARLGAVVSITSILGDHDDGGADERPESAGLAHGAKGVLGTVADASLLGGARGGDVSLGGVSSLLGGVFGYGTELGRPIERVGPGLEGGESALRLTVALRGHVDTLEGLPTVGLVKLLPLRRGCGGSTDLVAGKLVSEARTGGTKVSSRSLPLAVKPSSRFPEVNVLMSINGLMGTRDLVAVEGVLEEWEITLPGRLVTNCAKGVSESDSES
jgi:hypothetical protein